MDGPQAITASTRSLSDFESIFRAHHAALFHFLRRLLSSAEDVEDCLQETFLRFWRSRYSEQGQVKSYLFKIARNLAIDHLRSQQPAMERTTSLEEMEPALEDRSESEKSLDRNELAQLVREKVGQLPLPQRETFLMFRYHELSYQEIAEIQGVSVKTVDSRLYRAMKWLGQHLNGHFITKSEG